MRLDRFSMKWVVALLALLVTAALAAGCGGGGGGGSAAGGGGGSSASNITFSGHVYDTSGNGVSGVTVIFDGLSAYESTTGSSGAFSISVPQTALTGSDTLSALSNASTVAVYPIPSSTTSSIANISISYGPPPPPVHI